MQSPGPTECLLQEEKHPGEGGGSDVFMPVEGILRIFIFTHTQARVSATTQITDKTPSFASPQLLQCPSFSLSVNAALNWGGGLNPTMLPEHPL